MKRTLTATIGALAFAATVCAYESLQGPTELLYWDQDTAFNGYTLFGAHGRSFLIDMQGQVVHTWPIGTTPRLLENGNLLDAAKDDPSGFGGFRELDWDGNVVWSYDERRPGYFPHHDWVRIFNQQLNAPTTLYIANKTVTYDRAIATGADIRRDQFRDVTVDAIVEVDMNGMVVWEWWFLDHVVQDTDPTGPNYAGDGKTVADRPERIDINMPGRPLKRDWLHCNSLDYNSGLGQIVINSVQGELYVIDHDGTFIAGDPEASIARAAGPAGDFLYRFGDPARYGQGDPPRILENWDSATSGHKQMGGAHDVQWIGAGLPGAGHLMVFNNGQYLFDRTSQSSILEINGFLDAAGRDTGDYVNPPDAGYQRVRYDKDSHKPPRQISRQIIWSYQSKSNQGFFSHIGSGAQRLPNGNTLICAMTEGHLFEVTPDGELAWEYINPMTRDGAVKVLKDSLPMTNAVFRAYRYAPDHPALKNRELMPLGTLTERAEQGLDQRPNRRGRGEERDPQRRGGRRGDGRNRRDSETGRAGAQGDVASLRATELGEGYQFTEGPVSDDDGNIYFTDVRASRIYKRDAEGKTTLFRSNTGAANGLALNRNGDLVVCEGANGRLVAITRDGDITVLAGSYEGKRFNQPNDLWIDPRGGIYFSDPVYGRGERYQDGEHVYYISPDRSSILRVIDDMTRPNGLVGTPDGRTLYVADHGAGQTYRYTVNDDGTLAGKELFVASGSDGMALDAHGNLYLTTDGVMVYDRSGRQIARIDIPHRPTNVCTAGPNDATLFITARTAIYSVGLDSPALASAMERSPRPRQRQDGDLNRPDRQPWLVAHAEELDTDKDGGVSLAELVKHGEGLFMELDADGSDSLSEAECAPDQLPRHPLAGYVRGHFDELDANTDHVVTRHEMLDHLERIFARSDRDGDGKLTDAEPARRPRRNDR